MASETFRPQGGELSSEHRGIGSAVHGFVFCYGEELVGAHQAQWHLYTFLKYFSEPQSVKTTGQTAGTVDCGFIISIFMLSANYLFQEMHCP